MVRMIGRVVSGSGYDSKRDWGHYQMYPGTLNLMLQGEGVPPVNDHESLLMFDYFSCLPGKINNVDCLVCAPGNTLLSGRKGVAIIAAVNLRETLNLSDGNLVVVEMM